MSEISLQFVYNTDVTEYVNRDTCTITAGRYRPRIEGGCIAFITSGRLEIFKPRRHTHTPTHTSVYQLTFVTT